MELVQKYLTEGVVDVSLGEIKIWFGKAKAVNGHGLELLEFVDDV